VTAALTVPVGVSVAAIVNTVPSTSAFTMSMSEITDFGEHNAVQMNVLTNTLAQIRCRLSYSDGSIRVDIQTVGWVDKRGRLG
jgi:hypothetical protein